MLKNYLRFVFRNLKRNPGYLSINIIGLAVGIATVLLITLYIQHELSFDQYHEKKDRIYRLVAYSGLGEKQWNSYVAGDPIPEMRTSYSEVEDATKYKTCGSDFISTEGKRHENIQMICGESNLFNIFSFDLTVGDRNSVLEAPNTAVITHSLASRIFQDENPVGKTVPVNLHNEVREFEITGLMEDVPVNSHFRFDLLISYESLRSTSLCLDCGQPMYALLKEGADPGKVADRVLNHIRDVDGNTYTDDIKLEPLTEVYFSEIVKYSQGNFQYVLMMAAIAGLVLFIGCANYMNLATARFSQRSKEIGVRKVLGAHRLELLRQFYLETIILTLLALPLALFLLTIALPYFNDLADSEITLNWVSDYKIYASIFGLLMVIGIVAGSYPALFLSSFKPSDVIKGTLKPGFSATGVRKGLVFIQFLIAIVMIVVTGVIIQQLSFVQEKSLGFDTDQVVIATFEDPTLAPRYKTVQSRFKQIASVKHVSAAYGVPMQRANAHYIHHTEDGKSIEFVSPTIDSELINVLDLQLLAGQNITDGSMEKPQLDVMVNRAAVKALGWKRPQDAIGKKIDNRPVAGVVENFHIKPLHVKIQPVMMQANMWGQSHRFLIKLEGGNIPNALDNLRSAWKEMGGSGPLTINFADDTINQLYKEDQNTAKVIGFFAFLSILVGCIGLLGLATFATEQRIKEIGIRKVLGASITSIVMLFFKDFGKLILLSFLIAVPVGIFISNKWLTNFAYHIEPGPMIFLASGALVLILALLSTGIRSVYAARMNPAETLRN